MLMSQTTALERLLTGEARTVGPIDALAAARRRFLRGQRLDMQDLATELGISRATLYRWTGSRDRLLGEVLWSLAEIGVRQATEAAAGAHGAERIARFSQHMLRLTAASHGVRSLLDNEPEAGFRILTSKEGVQQRRLIEALEGLIGEEVTAGRFQSLVDPGDLAYAIVRVNESFLWRDLITGDEPDLEAADRVVRLLVGLSPS